MKETFNHQFWFWRNYKIHFIKEGENYKLPPLLLVHGFGSSTDQWMKNIIFLKNKFEVWAIDLLGFGRSTKADTEYSINLWCEQLRDFIYEVIGKPVVIIGNSIGGYMALFANSIFPEITCGAILLNPVGYFNESLESSVVHHQFFQKLIQKLFKTSLNNNIVVFLVFGLLKNRIFIRKTLRKIYSNESEVTEELVNNIYRPFCDVGAAKTFYRLSRISKGDLISVDILLKELNHPLFLIWGKHDNLLPDIQSTRRKYTRIYPLAVDVCIEAGHCPHDDASQIVNRLIEQWLNSLVALGRGHCSSTDMINSNPLED
jgi:pimeloyl-ACP methyl ester carboxylesterase